jgi:hypothetical protein
MGYGRWEAIKELGRINRWSLEEIANYAKAFLRKCVALSDPEEVKNIEILLNSPTDSLSNVSGADNMDEDSKVVKKHEEVIKTEKEEKKEEEKPKTEVIVKTEEANTVSDEGKKEEKKDDGGVKKEEESTAVVNFDLDPSLCEPKFQEYLQKNARQILRFVIFTPSFPFFFLLVLPLLHL